MLGLEWFSLSFFYINVAGRSVSVCFDLTATPDTFVRCEWWITYIRDIDPVWQTSFLCISQASFMCNLFYFEKRKVDFEIMEKSWVNVSFPIKIATTVRVFWLFFLSFALLVKIRIYLLIITLCCRFLWFSFFLYSALLSSKTSIFFLSFFLSLSLTLSPLSELCFTYDFSLTLFWRRDCHYEPTNQRAVWVITWVTSEFFEW